MPSSDSVLTASRRGSSSCAEVTRSGGATSEDAPTCLTSCRRGACLCVCERVSGGRCNPAAHKYGTRPGETDSCSDKQEAQEGERKVRKVKAGAH